MGFANVVAFWRLEMTFYWLPMAAGRLYQKSPFGLSAECRQFVENKIDGRVRDSRNVYEPLSGGSSSRSNDVMLITKIITFVLAAPRRTLY